MKTTPNLGLSYPEPGDHTRTWEYWEALAVRLDEKLGSRLLMTESGTISSQLAGLWVELATGSDRAAEGWTQDAAGRWRPPVNGWYDLGASIAYSGTKADIGINNGGLGGPLLLWQNGFASGDGVLRVRSPFYLDTTMALAVMAIGPGPTSVGQAVLTASLISQVTVTDPPPPLVYGGYSA